MRFLLAALLTGLLVSSPALADDAPYTIGTDAGWQVLAGPTFGGSFGDLGGSGYLGAELSLNRLSRGVWFGVYGDGVYEFGHSALYATGGLQLGYMIVGVDGGVAYRTGDADPSLGFTGRLLVALGLFDLYGRALVFDDDLQIQIGAMFKLPLWASE